MHIQVKTYFAILLAVVYVFEICNTFLFTSKETFF